MKVEVTIQAADHNDKIEDFQRLGEETARALGYDV
eukprot:CAMPEP_0185282542 /NCGR_PEP_ID=MMETSP1359-20130426/67332_1 /TAXON_ID=552665 /ORGANISM="Bigelowiella longifila, Strain CCMP242" /LENGTH=34 /DNA_ID= /DNA_START= /DNA_END= /DNA_ORIENTATION=